MSTARRKLDESFTQLDDKEDAFENERLNHPYNGVRTDDESYLIFHFQAQAQAQALMFSTQLSFHFPRATIQRQRGGVDTESCQLYYSNTKGNQRTTIIIFH